VPQLRLRVVRGPRRALLAGVIDRGPRRALLAGVIDRGPRRALRAGVIDEFPGNQCSATLPENPRRDSSF
jgi:hypothetical protein